MNDTHTHEPMIGRRRRLAGALSLAALVAVVACDSEPVGPMDDDILAADVSAMDFGTLDTSFGPGTVHTAMITNTGSAAISVGPITVTGDAASEFAVVGGGDMTSLAPGASVDVMVSFDPSSNGARSATLTISRPDGAGAPLTIPLSGNGAAFQYRQVDRIGIPGLNTVFNHPPQFSKTDYNAATPADDVATYTGLFETVLGAVGNANPSGTAALLLPDELPVDLSVGMTSFGSLNGRDLADDAVDVALSVVVGEPSLQSDNVDANDVGFGSTFPYLAPAN
jgi:hypothetical protein